MKKFNQGIRGLAGIWEKKSVLSVSSVVNAFACDPGRGCSGEGKSRVEPRIARMGTDVGKEIRDICVIRGLKKNRH